MPKAVCFASGNDGANSSSRMRFGHELCILADEKLIGRMLDSYPVLNPEKYEGKTNKSCMVDQFQTSP